MKKKERDAIYNQAISQWGVTAQIDQMIEEMAELTVAFNKYKRLKVCKETDEEKRKKVYNNLLMELGDVSMCLEQMMLVFPKNKIKKIQENQFKRLCELLKKES